VGFSLLLSRFKGQVLKVQLLKVQLLKAPLLKGRMNLVIKKP